MKNYTYLFIGLVVMACHSKPAAKTQPIPSGPFDLATLSLNENLSDLMKVKGIKAEPKDALDKTLLGYEVFKSSDPQLLRFKQTGFSGPYGKNKNHVLFHYNEAQNTLAGYEVYLYDQAQTDTLIGLVGQSGTLVFKRTKLLKGAIELDENGNEVKPENSERKTFRLWENKSTGHSYFLIETGSGANLITRLIVVKPSSPFGKDWISYLQLDWYKNAKSE
jgi:hypothetical protein